jgi:Asp-tRNA(Asn)/Glu-tRNA(Gln) amidotransferase A subunit family amidase
VAPIGLNSTGNAAFAVVSSYLRSPAASLPLLAVDALPIGVQVIGFRGRDADLIAIARWISATFPQPDIVTSVPAAAAVGCGPDPYRT